MWVGLFAAHEFNNNHGYLGQTYFVRLWLTVGSILQLVNQSKEFYFLIKGFIFLLKIYEISLSCRVYQAKTMFLLLVVGGKGFHGFCIQRDCKHNWSSWRIRFWNVSMYKLSYLDWQFSEYLLGWWMVVSLVRWLQWSCAGRGVYVGALKWWC